MARLLGTVSSSVQKSFGSFESIASLSGDGSSTTITFSSIPNTYQHLQLRFTAKATTGNSTINMRFNSDTSNKYARHWLAGDGASAFSFGAASVSAFYIGSAVYDSNISGVGIIDIHDYSSTSKYKTTRSFAGYEKNVEGEVRLWSGLWTSTSAISSITLFNASDPFTTNTSFALYGIKGI